MKKQLFFAAVLLVPSLADSANPSGDLSVQVVPPSSNGIACDIGPNYTGSIPAAAQAVGFTHCAANYDFSNTFYSNMANWLDCAGATTPQWWNLRYAGTAAVPCGRYNVIADSAFGTNALQSIFQPADWPASSSTEIDTTNTGSPTFGSSPGFFFASTFYAEVVEYVTANTQNNAYTGTSCGSAPAGIFGVWTWATPDAVETDFMEFYAGLNKCTNGGNTIDHGNGASIQLGSVGGQAGQQSGYDPTIPHNYGTLQTASGTTFTRCNYIDGTQLGSGCLSATFTSGAPTTKSWLKITIGPENTNAGSQPLVNEDHRVQRITVWECNGYKTGPC